MSATDKEIIKKNQTSPTSAPGSLFSLSEFDSFFDDFMAHRWPRLLDWNLEKSAPKVDILDRDTEIEIQAALPGVSKDNLDVTLNNQTITISATTQEEKKTEEDRYYRREISRGEFKRSLSLPENVDSDKAKASFKDGILKVIIPKTEQSKRKSIEITE